MRASASLVRAWDRPYAQEAICYTSCVCHALVIAVMVFLLARLAAGEPGALAVPLRIPLT